MRRFDFSFARRWRLICLLLISVFAASCTQDAYEKGDGKYSLMRGDFVEAQVDHGKQMVSITTDDGDQLPLVQPFTAKWITTADTVYRCMLYYNKVEDTQGKASAEVISIGQVPCPLVKPLKEFDKELRTDPVGLESLWLSRSGKYLNLYLQLKTGVTEDTSAVQQLAFLSDTLITHANQSTTRHLILHHDQNRVPEHYSTKAYVSIPVASIGADSVRLSINTYDGPVEKILKLKP